MKTRPILFNGAMVRALLDGSKTQTRRVVKGSDKWPSSVVRATLLESRGTVMGVDARRCTYGPEIKCPYGQPGDRLWVRETFVKIIGQTAGWIETDYFATYKHGDRLGDSMGVKKKWTPSIHMPRDASRITLEIVNVRVERLQSISESDAVAEGWTRRPEVSDDPDVHTDAARDWYMDLWESINGPDSWSVNPWVWVVEFRRLP